MSSLSSSLAQIVRRVSVLLLVAPQFACGGAPPAADAAADAAVADAAVADAGPPYDCLGTMCSANAEFCYLRPRFGGADAGVMPQLTTEWYAPECVVMPAACAATPTCACVRAALQSSTMYPGFACTEVAPGGPRIEGMTGGRTTEGVAHATPSARGASPVSAWLASVATLEAEAVLAFERLSHELASHRAPDALVARMKRAADEERTHAALLESLAREHGAAPAVAVAAPSAVRPLVSIAVENAAEGLGRELYGALVAHWQAAHAPTERLRALFARIAEDESRHAEDSLALDAWARPRLTPRERALLDEARERALEALLAAPDAQGPELVAALGLPDARVRSALVRALRETPSFSLAH